METVEKKSIAGQQTAIQTDFSTRNALARIIRCLFAEKLLDDNKLQVILSLNQWMVTTEWCNPMKNLWGY